MVNKIMKKILLLGASGFAGRNVAEALTAAGIPFTSASRSTGLDLRDSDAVAAFVQASQPDYIINCAAMVGSLHFVTEQAADVICENTRIILGLYQGIQQSGVRPCIINPLANCAYPANVETFVEDQWLNGPVHRSVLSFGNTRRMLWAVSECYQMQHQIKSLSLFVPNMYGPFDSTDPAKAHAMNALVAKFVKAVREGKQEIPIWGTGVAIREWLYAGDFARIIMKIVMGEVALNPSQPVNIAQNCGISIRELVDLLCRHFNYKGEIKWDPSMPDGAPRKVMDDHMFKNYFSDFQFTDLKTGVERSIAYYQSIYPY